jgi:hypothetical protein
MSLSRAFASLLAVALSLSIGTAYGANWYVRPSATGSNNGSSWNNAWSASSINWGSVNAGDVVWLAGGSYSSRMTVSKSGTSASPIRINRVRSTDSTPSHAAGWSASFDSQVKLPGGTGISIPTASHIIVNGRIADGIVITIPKSGGYGIQCGATGTTSGDLKFYYVDVVGPYGSGSNPVGSEVMGWKISPSTSTMSSLLFNHCVVRGVGIGVHCLATNVTIEYCYIADIASDDGQEHPDILYSYPSPNMTWRYNTIVNCTVDGVFFEYGGAVNFRFYGNLFYNTPNHQIYFKGPDTYGPIYIYNNTFLAPSASSYGYVTASNGQVVAGSQVYNNIFFNVENSLSGISGVTSDYNAYNYTTLNGFGWPSNEKHSFTFTGSPFVDLGNGKQQPPKNCFDLTAASAATFRRGLTLASDGYLNKDRNGSTRGIGGAWEIGAFEYSAAISAPSELRILADVLP